MLKCFKIFSLRPLNLNCNKYFVIWFEFPVPNSNHLHTNCMYQIEASTCVQQQHLYLCSSSVCMHPVTESTWYHMCPATLTPSNSAPVHRTCSSAILISTLNTNTLNNLQRCNEIKEYYEFTNDDQAPRISILADGCMLFLDDISKPVFPIHKSGLNTP